MWMLFGPTNRTVMLVGSPMGAANTNKQVNKQQTDKKNTNQQIKKGKLRSLEVLAMLLLKVKYSS